MLKGINPLMTPELLTALARMGHGDTIAVVDSNYPAYATGRPVVPMPSLDAPEAVRLIVELMPLDTFVEAPVQYMTGAAGEDMREVTRDVLDAAARTEGRAIHGAPLDRFDFYERARAATIVVHTQETRPYGCYLLTKGDLPTFGPEPAS